VLQLLRHHQCVTSALLPVEFRSALRRRASDGSLDSRRVPGVLKHFVADREFWASIEVTSEVLQAAEKLVAAHPLRTLDAIHVASAELFTGRLTA
jgi:predicted nucleic acid-binding protein